MARPRTKLEKLTMATIGAAQPGAAVRYLWDSDVPGLGVIVRQNGSRSFIVQRGKVRKALGVFPEMKLLEARRLAAEPLAAMRAGRNPIQERREKQAADQRERRARKLCDELWERYEVEVVAHNKVTTQVQKRRMWRTKIEPIIGAVAVRDVDADHAREIINAILPHRGEANNVYRLLRHLMRVAISWGYRAKGSDPCEDIRLPKVKARERLLTDAERSALNAATDALGAQWQIKGALRFLLLTGWRRDEVCSLKRSYIDRKARTAALPDTKTGHSVRPLSRAALELLDGLPRVVGSEFVFPSVHDHQRSLPHSTFAHTLKRLCRIANVDAASPHVIRHKVVTEIANAAPNVKVAMALSGHKDVGTFMRYVHAERMQALEVADAVADKITAL